MLMQIHIRDLVTIEELHLDLNKHTTMITGETGAGKSIFIEAIELALGGRASQTVVRKGKEKTEISLCFDITKAPKAITYLQALELYQDSFECIIRRVIMSDGRSRCYINGSPTTVNSVKELGELLFHLHGQHEQQVLLNSDTQRDMLDRFGNHLNLSIQVKALAEDWRKIDKDAKELREKLTQRNERIAYLGFQLEELKTLKLRPGEWEELETEHHRLTHADELLRHLQQALEQLNHEEKQNLISELHHLRKIFESIQSLEPKAKQWLETVNTAIVPLSDLVSELNHYLEQTALDTERLQFTEERVSQIFNLSRKHRVDPQELYALTENLQNELSLLNSTDEELKKLEARQKKIEQEYQAMAAQLSASREKAAAKLEKEITTTIRSLSLPHGTFKIDLETINHANDILSLHGNEKIVFLIKTNPDQTLQPLNKVISGGELSRLSLALHLSLANKQTIPTLIFDEVDTGLSGATAEKIGKLLQKLGDDYQVFCVTHQAQVAACAHHHLLVEKYFVDKTTHTRLRLLNNKEKTAEIARMLGGEKITQKTLEHAQEILQMG